MLEISLHMLIFVKGSFSVTFPWNTLCREWGDKSPTVHPSVPQWELPVVSRSLSSEPQCAEGISLKLHTRLSLKTPLLPCVDLCASLVQASNLLRGGDHNGATMWLNLSLTLSACYSSSCWQGMDSRFGCDPVLTVYSGLGVGFLRVHLNWPNEYMQTSIDFGWKMSYTTFTRFPPPLTWAFRPKSALC